jgi:polyketide cyclase/dehydrase/lipid transport protein
MSMSSCCPSSRVRAVAVMHPSYLSAMAYPTAVSRQIAAPAQKVWELVSDLPRMGEWSPENVGGKWIKGASGPATGAVFTGRNRSGNRRWSTKVTVVDCQPGQSFEIAISLMGLKISNWRYEFADAAGGCTVTESWDDHRTPFMRFLGSPMGDHSGEHAKTEMEATLANLAKVAEG